MLCVIYFVLMRNFFFAQYTSFFFFYISMSTFTLMSHSMYSCIAPLKAPLFIAPPPFPSAPQSASHSYPYATAPERTTPPCYKVERGGGEQTNWRRKKR